MITVKYDKPIKLKTKQSIFVSFPYKAKIVDVMRTFYGRYYHADTKTWELDYSSLDEIKRQLPNEEFTVIGKPISNKKFNEKEVDRTISLPKNLKTELYPFQIDTFYEGMAYDKYIFNLDCGLGKAQPLYSKVLTPNGYITMGEVKVGAEVIGEDGKPHKVLGVFPQGKKPVYELTFSDGTKCRCSDEHLWTVQVKTNHNKFKTMTLKEIMSCGLYRERMLNGYKVKTWRFKLPNVSPINFKQKHGSLPIDPWLFGLLLGDGSFINGVSISLYEDDIKYRVIELLSSINMQLGAPYNVDYGDFNIISKSSRDNYIRQQIQRLGLSEHKSENKFIPDVYKYASVTDRLNLLRGLYDSDGYTAKNYFTISTSSKQLAEDIVFLVQSLGGTCSCNEHETYYTHNGKKQQGLNNFELYIKLPNGDVPYTTMKHKKAHGGAVSHTSVCRTIRSVDYVGDEECQCIYVDNPTHLYITDNFIPTHNTMCSLAVVSKRMELGQVKRCLIIPCVATLKYNWQDEIKKHLGEESKVLGNRQNKKGAWSVKSNADKLEDLNHLNKDDKWLITNVESLRDTKIKEKLKKLLDKGEIDCIIVDECHKCAHTSAQQTKALMLLENHCKYTLLLTGTILMNKPTDLYVPLKIMGIEEANFSQFKSRYCIMGGWNDYQVVGFKHLDHLQNNLNLVSKRLRKKEVLKDLPDRIFKEEYVEMGTKQAKIYDEVLRDMVNNIDNVKLSPNPLSQMIRLRQATADTSILSSKVKESAKFERALELIDDIIENGEAVLVFSNWETVINNFEAYIGNKYMTAKITGKVKDTDRESEKLRFNGGDCNIMLMTMGAGGTGLTLNRASNIIMLDEPWTATDLEQCTSRCHRIGQDNVVIVYTLICMDTIDANIHKIIKRKSALSEGIVDNKYDLKNPKVVEYLLTGEGEI